MENWSRVEPSKTKAELSATDALIVQKITDQIVHLRSEWRMFLYLFATEKRRAETIFASSGFVARTLRNALWDGALLRLRRLTDPLKSGGNENLSIGCLKEIALRSAGIDLSLEHAAAMQASKPARDYSSKYLAHNDMRHVLGRGDTTICRKETNEAIAALATFVKLFHERVRNSTYMLTASTAGEDEQKFLLHLYLGQIVATEWENAELRGEASGAGGAQTPYNVPDWLFDRKMRDDPFDEFANLAAQFDAL